MTRADLPKNEDLDAHHKRQREITLEYLRDKTTRDERKEILKEAINDWLNEKYLAVGKWTVAGILAAIVALVGWFVLVSNGYHK